MSSNDSIRPDPSAVLHPAMRQVLERAAVWRAGKPDRYRMPFPQSRELLLAERQAWVDDSLPPIEGRAMRAGGARSVAVSRYAPSDVAAPLIVYLHGGGWCVGSAGTHDALVRHLAAATGCEVWSVDYALAPEAPYPAGLLDCEAVIGDAIERKGARQVYVAGDSAGANLALAAALWRRDQGQALPAGLLLYYGVYTDRMDDDSMRAYGDGGFGLSIAVHQRYLQAYLSGGPGPGRSYVFPLDEQVDLTGLPRTWMMAAACDILHDQSIRMRDRLRASAVPVDWFEAPGVIHGFLAYGGALPQVAETFERSRRFIGAN